jgi:eukaryotic-like serine/threonine-protein kinase
VTTTASSVCPRCGQPLGCATSEGLCSVCLLTAGQQYDYTIVNILAQGALGTVYLAEQQPTCRLVALKILNPHADAIEFVKRLRDVRQGLVALGHSHVARVFDVGLVPERRPYVVTEYVRGAPITTYCQQSSCDQPVRQRLLDMVFDVIGCAHGRGMTHGRIKPSNILVVRGPGDPIIKVTDFGLRAAEPADDRRALERLTATVL